MLLFRLKGDRLHIEGQVDAATVEAFEARITEAIGSGPVILDMTGVDFIDSSGLRVLLTASRLVRPGRRLRIVPSEQVRRVFNVTGLDALPDIEFLLPAGGSSWPPAASC
jgi:anti-sigma B factor antagonist